MIFKDNQHLIPFPQKFLYSNMFSRGGGWKTFSSRRQSDFDKRKLTLSLFLCLKRIECLSGDLLIPSSVNEISSALPFFFLSSENETNF